MSAFTDWESYFYPETIGRLGNGVLKNKFGLRDARMLRQFEYEYADFRAFQLRRIPGLITRTFDAAHLRAIHGFLFQDTYEWAGQYRTVNMFKGDSGFARIEEIEDYLQEAAFTVTVTDWANATLGEFSQQAATVFAYVNQVHPFREGNGHSSKMFMEHLAGLSTFRMDFSRVKPAEWNRASALSS